MAFKIESDNSDKDIFLAFRDETIDENSYEVIYPPESGKPVYSKLQILKSMKDQALQKASESPLMRETAQKVADRAERKIGDLQKGLPVRMPHYFHTTKELDVVGKIMKGSILSTEAKEGKGAYLSTEMEIQYGSFIFALDRDDVEKKSLSQSNVNKTKTWPESRSTKAVWRALDDDLPINSNGVINIAYLVLTNSDNQKDVEKILEGMKLTKNVEVVTYEEALFEREILQKVQGVIEPKEWSRSWKGESKSINSMLDRVSTKQEVPVETSSEWDD